MAVQQYQALYSIIGGKFGGTPNSTFNVPDLKGFATVGVGQRPGFSNYAYGIKVGSEGVALTNANLPSHDHNFNGRTGSAATVAVPTDNSSYISNFTYLKSDGTRGPLSGYVDPQTNPVNINPASVLPFGTSTSYTSGSAHENRSPYLAIYYCICWDGLYPVRP